MFVKHRYSSFRLSLTEQLGKTLYQWCEAHSNVAKRYLPLAQTVYKAVRAHVPAVVCMLQQGRIHQAVGYAKNKAMYVICISNVFTIGRKQKLYCT